MTTTTAPAKRKPGRPATGETPVKLRKAKSDLSLAQSGGRRLEIRLSGTGVGHLAAVHADNPGLNDTEAVHLALAWYANRLKRE